MATNQTKLHADQKRVVCNHYCERPQARICTSDRIQVVWEADEQLTDSELVLVFEMLFPEEIGDLTVCEEALNSSCKQH